MLNSFRVSPRVQLNRMNRAVNVSSAVVVFTVATIAAEERPFCRETRRHYPEFVEEKF